MGQRQENVTENSADANVPREKHGDDSAQKGPGLNQTQKLAIK